MIRWFCFHYTGPAQAKPTESCRECCGQLKAATQRLASGLHYTILSPWVEIIGLAALGNYLGYIYMSTAVAAIAPRARPNAQDVPPPLPPSRGIGRGRSELPLPRAVAHPPPPLAVPKQPSPPLAVPKQPSPPLAVPKQPSPPLAVAKEPSPPLAVAKEPKEKVPGQSLIRIAAA